MERSAAPRATALLGAGIPIVEHLRGLEQLPVAGFRCSATPVMVRGMGSFPVRAWAKVERQAARPTAPPRSP